MRQVKTREAGSARTARSGRNGKASRAPTARARRRTDSHDRHSTFDAHAQLERLRNSLPFRHPMLTLTLGLVGLGVLAGVLAGGSEHVVPAKLNAAVAEEAMRLAERAHAALGCRGVSRTDFRYDDTEGRSRLIVLEVNTQPGMTPTSLVPEQAAHRGKSFRALVRWILEDASCDR